MELIVKEIVYTCNKKQPFLLLLYPLESNEFL